MVAYVKDARGSHRHPAPHTLGLGDAITDQRSLGTVAIVTGPAAGIEHIIARALTAEVWAMPTSKALPYGNPP